MECHLLTIFVNGLDEQRNIIFFNMNYEKQGRTIRLARNIAEDANAILLRKGCFVNVVECS
jgi:hypothetical protein